MYKLFYLIPKGEVLIIVPIISRSHTQLLKWVGMDQLDTVDRDYSATSAEQCYAGQHFSTITIHVHHYDTCIFIIGSL